MSLPREFEVRLRKRQVIPFVGAGVSRAVLRENGQPLFPGWRDLLLHAAVRLKEEGKPSKSQIVEGLVTQPEPDFLDAARHAQAGLGPLWAEFLKKELDPPSQEADPKSLALASALWDLESPLIVTTNYDNVLQWACPEPFFRDLAHWDIEAKVEHSQLLQSWKPPHPTVWHLHGRIGNAAELILTAAGYQRLHGNGSSESRYQAALITFRALLASQSLLFVGFSFEDEALGLQLQGVHELFAGSAGPHYALVRENDAQRVRSLGLPLEVITFAEFSDLLPLVRKIGGIAKEGETSLGGAHSTSSAAVPPGASYSIDNRPFFVPFRSKGDKVIGAEGPLQRVREQLTLKGPTNIGQTAAFEGLGGLGKTQLAVEYAWRYQDQYPNGVIWLTTDQDIPAQLTRLAVEAQWVSADSEHKLKLEVAQHRVRSYSDCLIVFDNLEDLASIQPYLPLHTAHPHLLATSRTEQPGFVPVPLDVLDVNQSLNLLISEAGRSPVGEEEQKAAKEIAEDLGGLPLALEMAGAFLLYRRVQWQQYRNLLKSNPKEALRGKHLTSFTSHEKDLYATLRIQEEVFEDEPLLRDLLDVLTWSGSAPMGVSLLAALLAVEETALLGALSLGAQLRLLERSADVDRYGLHRLVRKVRQEDEPIGEQFEWAEEICRRLGDWFAVRRKDFADLAAFEAEIDHLHIWRQQAESLNNSQAGRLTWLLAYPPFHRGQYQEANRWLVQAHALQKDSSNLELSAWLWNDLGSISVGLGDYKSALKYGQQALEIRRDVLGMDPADTALALDNVGNVYRRLGDFSRAQDFLMQALAIRREVLGEEHPDTATSLSNVGRVFYERSEWDKAFDYYTQALTIRKVIGEEHPDTARLFENVGDIFRKRSEWDKAFDYHIQALTIRQKLLGENHPETANALISIGNVYKDRGELEEVLSYYTQALTIRQKVLGEEHPDTTAMLTSVAHTHFLLGHLGEALRLELLALEIWRRIFGKDHPKTIASVIHAATVLKDLDRRDEGFKLLAPLMTNPPSEPAQAQKVKFLIQKLKAQPLRPGFRSPAARGKGKKKRR
jgi:tetratricopeptide (TPR) repeat protein